MKISRLILILFTIGFIGTGFNESEEVPETSVLYIPANYDEELVNKPEPEPEPEEPEEPETEPEPEPESTLLVKPKFGDPNYSLKKELVEYDYPCYDREYEEVDKYGKKVWVIKDTGMEVPANMVSTHAKKAVFSNDLYELQLRMARAIPAWEWVAEELDITYTLSCGNLIPYYHYDGLMLPWDDDVDLVVKESDWGKVEKWWKEAEDLGVVVGTHKNKWMKKRVMVSDVEVILWRAERKEWTKWWIKMEVNVDGKKFDKLQMGCVDIFRCQSYNSRTKLCGLPYKVSRGPRPDQSKEDYPKVEICGMEVRAPPKNVALEWALGKYGNGIMKIRHPDLQKHP